MTRVAGVCFWMFFFEGRAQIDDALWATFLVTGGVPEGQRRRCGRLCGLFVTASGNGIAAGKREAPPDAEASKHLACELLVEANELLLVVPCKVEACEEAETNEHDAWKTEACEGEEANEPEACNVEACCEGEVHEIEVSPELIERMEDL